MRTNCAMLLACLFLCSCATEFLDGLVIKGGSEFMLGTSLITKFKEHAM